MSNAELLGKLEQWALQRKILPKSFDCPHYNKCNNSLEKKGMKLDYGNTCQMSYVGKEYGKPELAPGKPFRLVIAGIDPGANYEEQKLEGFTECQQDMEDCYYGKPFDKRHPHYLGVVRTAAAILGKSGKHCLEHCYEGSKCLGEGRPQTVQCVLRSFAQPNLVKCGPLSDSRRSESTPMMFRHCPEHLVSEIEVLQPELVVFHGSDAEWAFRNVMDEKGYKHTELPNSPKHLGFPMVHEVSAPDGRSKFYCLYLLHPSFGNLDRQWDSERTVEPALELLRSRGAIPLA